MFSSLSNPELYLYQSKTSKWNAMKCVTTTISEKQYILSEQGTVPNHFFTTSYVIANAVPLLSFPNPNKFKFVPACWSSSTKQTSGRKSSILRLHIQMAYCFRAFLSVLQMTWPYQYLASLRLAHVSSWLPRHASIVVRHSWTTGCHGLSVFTQGSWTSGSRMIAAISVVSKLQCHHT